MKASMISTLALAAAVVAVPTPASECSDTPSASSPTSTAEASSTPYRFGGIAIRSGSEIQYLPIHANGQAFWLNKNTTTYCPDVVGSACPDNDAESPAETVFTSGANTGSLSLDVIVPGGQQVYVTPEGQLKFTQAHSASVEEGSLRTGFVVTDDGALQFEHEDWFACPLGPQNGNAYGVWAVSRVAGSNAGEECLNFRFRTEEAGDDVATQWQYE